MSYTLIVPSTPKSGLVKALSSAIVVDEFDGEHADDLIKAHIDVIAEAAIKFAQVVGRPDDEVIIEITGHVNPDHEPLSDKSNDVLSVTIRQVADRPLPKPDFTDVIVTPGGGATEVVKA